MGKWEDYVHPTHTSLLTKPSGHSCVGKIRAKKGGPMRGPGCEQGTLQRLLCGQGESRHTRMHNNKGSPGPHHPRAR